MRTRPIFQAIVYCVYFGTFFNTIMGQSCKKGWDVVGLSDLSEGKSINSWGIATFPESQFHTSFIYHKSIIPSDHNLKPPGHDTKA